jgi:hypothetical protein
MATKIVDRLTVTGSAYITGGLEVYNIPAGYSTYTSSFSMDNGAGGITIATKTQTPEQTIINISPGTLDFLVKKGDNGTGFSLADSNGEGFTYDGAGYLSINAPSMSFFSNATPTTRPAAIANATGGATVDNEARTAINQLLQAMRDLGLIAI